MAGMKTLNDWNIASRNKRNLWIHRHVFGQAANANCYIADYTGDAHRDVEVLRHVREHWSVDRCHDFARALDDLLMERRTCSNIPLELWYEAGFYSTAAFVVLARNDREE